jgi:hypothetical protein
MVLYCDKGSKILNVFLDEFEASKRQHFNNKEN